MRSRRGGRPRSPAAWSRIGRRVLEFAPEAGWWGLVEVSGDEWEPRVKSALRLLADSGFGGERSLGWGRAAASGTHRRTALFGAETLTPRRLVAAVALFAARRRRRSTGRAAITPTVTRAGWTDSTAGGPSARSASA